MGSHRARLSRGAFRMPGQPLRLQGALLPLELLPKISPQAGVYKATIAEFMPPSVYVRHKWMPDAIKSVFGRGEYFLLLLLPISFLVPAAWTTWTEAARRDGPPRPSFAGWWLLGMAVATGLTIFATISLPLAGTPSWLIRAGRWVPMVVPHPGSVRRVGLGLAVSALGGALGVRRGCAWPAVSHGCGPDCSASSRRTPGCSTSARLVGRWYWDRSRLPPSS